MRIFITGATGFFGSHVAAALLAAGHDVAALMRPATDPWRLATHFDRMTGISGTLDDPTSFSSAFSAFKPDAVASIAWRGVGNTVHDDPEQERNLDLLQGLLKLAADTGVTSWVGLGSQAEYGPKDHPVRETDPPSPQTAYGRAKLAASQMTAEFCARHGIRHTWLRLFSCYGPMDKESWLIPSLILKLLDNQTPALTDGRQRMDYLYAPDAADAVRLVLETPDAAGTFNLASGEACTVRDIALRIRDLIDPERALGFGKIAPSPHAQMLMQGDIAALRAATGWRPETSLDEGLAATVGWYRERR